MRDLRGAGGPILAGFASLAAATPLHAHDFWIEPSAYRLEVGSVLKIRLRVGEGFRGEPVPRNPARIERFVLAGPAGEQEIAGLDGADPAGFTRVDTPGLLVIGYRSRRASLKLEAQEFEKYLAEEGLERVIAVRAQRREGGQPGREVYSRCAKSLVLAGSGETSGHDRRLGFTLELVAGENPYTRPAEKDLPIRVLYQGLPAEDVLVVAMPQGEPGKKVASRSDRDGRVVFKVSQPGAWLVKAVHMVRAPADVDADWESFWASLTFEVRR